MFSSLFYSEFDLYTKSDSLPDLEALTPYYQSLIDKYIPGTVRWWSFQYIFKQLQTFLQPMRGVA